MYINKDLFNNLRDYQKPTFQEIMNAGKKVLLKAPMDFGKTYISCAYISNLFKIGKISSASISVPNYQMRNKIVKDIRSVGMENAVIVCLEGKERAFRSHKKKRTSSIKATREELKGKTVDVEYVEEHFKGHNPYYVLMHLQKFADIIILHHSTLLTNHKIRRTDLLIVDDADLMNRKTQFTIKKYGIFENHLQAVENEKTYAQEIRDKIKGRIKKNPNKLNILDLQLDYLFDFFPNNPEVVERKNIIESELNDEFNRNKKIEKIIENLETKGKTDDEILQRMALKKDLNIRIGLFQSSNPEKWESLLKEVSERMKYFGKELSDQIEKETNYAISSAIDYQIEDFVNALIEPEFHVKKSKISDKWFSLEIYLTNASKFMGVVNQYNRILWISATADPDDFKDYEVVKTNHDPNANFKHVKEITTENVPELLDSLKNHNVFVVTNSGNGAKNFVEKYGTGEILTTESFNPIIRDARNGKGVIAVSYINGIGSRGLDHLSMLFDAVILESYIYRSVIKENGIFYGDEHTRNNLNDTVQIIARILRGSKDHVLFVVKDESETGPKVFDFLKEQNPDWNYVDGGSYNDLISRIPERTQVEKQKTVLKKNIQKLKNGDILISYTGKTKADDVERYPDSLEL